MDYRHWHYCRSRTRHDSYSRFKIVTDCLLNSTYSERKALRYCTYCTYNVPTYLRIRCCNKQCLMLPAQQFPLLNVKAIPTRQRRHPRLQKGCHCKGDTALSRGYIRTPYLSCLYLVRHAKLASLVESSPTSLQQPWLRPAWKPPNILSFTME